MKMNKTLIEQNNKSSLFFVDNDDKVYLKVSNSSTLNELKNSKCKSLSELLSIDKFGQFIRDHRAVFMVHGTDNVGSLSKIMDIAEKVYNNQVKEIERGE